MCRAAVRWPVFLISGRDPPIKRPGALPIKLPIDYSITSAYEPAGSPVKSPTSPNILQRTTSQKNPPRPSLSSHPPSFARTLSTSSYGGATSKRPIPAPRTSLGSRTSSDYQPIDIGRLETRVKDFSPTTPSQPYRTEAQEMTGALHRASTLPTSVNRPGMRGGPPSYPALNRSNTSQDKTDSSPDAHMDTDLGSLSRTSSTLDHQSSRSSSRRGSHSAAVHLSSRSSLTDPEKKERRKSELLENSPYPRLSSLVRDGAAYASPSTASHWLPPPPPLLTKHGSDPVYSIVNKGRVSPANTPCAANMFGRSEAVHMSGAARGNSPSSFSRPPSRNSPIYERISALYSSSQSNSSGSQSNYSEPTCPGTRWPISSVA